MNLDEALRMATQRLKELQAVERRLRERPLLFDVRSLPPPPPRVPRGAGAAASEALPPPTLAPAQVLEHWQRAGLGWLAQLGLRDLSAVAAATNDVAVGPVLASTDAFASALLPKVRARRRVPLATRLYFLVYPPRPSVVRQVRQVFDEALDNRPGWSRAVDVGDPQKVLNWLAGQVSRKEWRELQVEQGLPDVLCRSTWAEHVVSRAPIHSGPEALRLLRFPDAGEMVSKPALVGPATEAAVRQLARIGEQHATLRVELAAAISARVGELFGTVDDLRWTRLQEVRAQLRRWVVGEILDVLFLHLAAPSARHQTVLRRAFWGKYSAKVARMWLLVPRSMHQLLEHGDVRDLLDRVGSLVEIRELEGQQEQAILWMHLLTDRGTVLSVTEGNANTPCRFAAGAVAPPAGRDRKGRLLPVHYSQHIMKGAFRELPSLHHLGDWGPRLAARLREFGVRP
ncbi:MAG: hypothetical protein ABMB14_09015 [Myxococcota bacterium]